MAHDYITPEQIKRRLLDRVRNPQSTPGYGSASLSTGSLMPSHPLMSSESGLFRRIRHKIVVDILPIFKLATHNGLLRAYGALDEAKNAIKQLTRERDDANNTIRQLTRERDEVLSLLRTVAPDRDRLASETQVLHRQLGEQAQALAQAQSRGDELEGVLAHRLASETQVLHRQLGEQAQALAQAQSRGDVLESILAQVKEERDWLRERLKLNQESVQLPQTIHADAKLPNQQALDEYLSTLDAQTDQQEDDVLYYALETSFRGSEAVIKQRQSEYLDDLPFTNPHLPVIDLGCGRGEFLELLRERDIQAIGVEPNTSNVQTLGAKGLYVVQQGAVEYLQSLEPNSLAAVTAFQVVEHVPHQYLRDLIRLAYEKIAPGGFIFLETVNPYCLETFRTYYLDPTHKNPIPPDLLTLLVQFFGFEQTKVFYQNPIRDNLDSSQQDAMHLYYQTYGAMGIKP